MARHGSHGSRPIPLTLLWPSGSNYSGNRDSRFDVAPVAAGIGRRPSLARAARNHLARRWVWHQVDFGHLFLHYLGDKCRSWSWRRLASAAPRLKEDGCNGSGGGNHDGILSGSRRAALTGRGLTLERPGSLPRRRGARALPAGQGDAWPGPRCIRRDRGSGTCEDDRVHVHVGAFVGSFTSTSYARRT